MKYVALLRGINVGGNRKVPMAELKICFENVGHTDVKTYINSGNVIFTSDISDVKALQKALELEIEKACGFLVEVLVIDSKTFLETVETAPTGFGTEPNVYHSDVIFLLGENPKSAAKLFELNPEVDKVWEGNTVVYFQRLSEKRTKSKLSKIIAKPIYKKMTIRSWNTTCKLANMLKES